MTEGGDATWRDARKPPVDPDEGPAQQLAHALRGLREQAGNPTYRDMAQRSGCGASTLSNAAVGRRMPTLETVLAYARACGGDPAEWERRWNAAMQQESAAHGPEHDDDPPYRGLRPYEPADRHLFFGRDHITAQLA